MALWFVCDMDDGVLVVRESRAAALEWWRYHQDAPKVLERHTYGPGAYGYIVGHDRYDCARSISIIRKDKMAGHGYDPRQKPLYPYFARPYERVERW